ncbi:riboflavin transporter FmnP [Chryseomicrobium excrementi]|uniref:Riboflavin transporter n=1 Tax=Chryseomicrobium excrementi TaxID=2041346 RepID=A0A2M9F2U8_9BACL|nr:ECF transporter S component [Chryseomicrobium excrementi]PJK17793.1 riboflavin transporter FmnP [Chryseomicrobium excrementi]
MFKSNTRKLIAVAMLSSLSFILMLLAFPLPALPAYLKVDFSDVPALIAAITMGPVAGIAVAFLKNVLDWFFSGSPTGVPVGHMANFVTSILFITPVYLIYKKVTSSKGMYLGLVAGTVSMAIGMTLLNYLVFLPMYAYFLNFPMETGSALMNTLVYGILPFNLIKGAFITVVMVLVFKKLKPYLDKVSQSYQLT